MFSLIWVQWYSRNLGHRLFSRRIAAIQRLEDLGDIRAVPALVALLADSDAGIRCLSARALGRLGDLRAVAPLLNRLNDPIATCLGAVIEALGNLQDRQAVSPLISRLGHREPKVRLAAAMALGKLGESQWAIWVLGDDKDIERLGTSGDPRAFEAVAMALTQKPLRRAAAVVLGQLGDTKAVLPLLDAMDLSSSLDGGSAVIEALGKLGDPRAVDPLIAALSTRDHYLRFLIVRTLGQLEDQRAFEPLSRFLAHGYSSLYPVRCEAARALGRLNDRRAIPSLIAILGSSSRVVAAEALTRLGESSWADIVKGDIQDFARLSGTRDARVLEPLIRGLIELEPSERAAAVRALGDLGDVRAIAPLVEVLADPDGEVRCASSEALAALGEPKWIQLIRGDEPDFLRLAGSGDHRLIDPLLSALNRPYPHPNVCEALGLLGDPRSVVGLIGVLNSTDVMLRDDSRISAARALGRLRDHRATDSLIAALGDRSGRLASAAVWALGEIGDSMAVKPLLRILNASHQDVDYYNFLGPDEAKETLCLEAITALVKTRDERAVPALRSLLSHPSPEIRKKASASLAEIGQ